MTRRKKAPRPSGPTLWIGDQPGEVTSERLEAAGFRDVTTADLDAEQLRAELRLLASRYAMRGRGLGDEDAERIGHLLSAIADGHPKWREWASKARDWIVKHNRGAPTRAQEADGLAACIERTEGDGDSARAMAEAVVRRMRCYPLLAKGTCVPVSPALWVREDRELATAAVEQAIDRALELEHDVEKTARAVLRALGMSKERADNAYKHRDARTSRGKKTSK